MDVKQIYELVNQSVAETIGDTVVLNEDLSNLVTVGEELFNANAMDNYVYAILNKIGRTIFQDRVYNSSAPNIMRDGWEYGSVLEKIRAELPEFVENQDWELQDGVSYDDHIFYQPKVSVKYFNSRVAFSVNLSFTKKQLRESFHNEQSMNAFLSMLFNKVNTAFEIATEKLTLQTINNFTAETIYNEYKGVDTKTKTTFKAVNLLKEYNDLTGQTLTVDKALIDGEFLRYAIVRINKYSDSMRRASKLFNIGGVTTFTPKDMQHLVLLSDFAQRVGIYLYATNRHNEFIDLPKHETVTYWQGSGTDYSFNSLSSIDVKTSENNTVKQSGIIGVLFDKDACMIANEEMDIDTSRTASASFYTNYYKKYMSYYNDFNENFIVFFMA